MALLLVKTKTARSLTCLTVARLYLVAIANGVRTVIAIFSIDIAVFFTPISLFFYTNIAVFV